MKDCTAPLNNRVLLRLMYLFIVTNPKPQINPSILEMNNELFKPVGSNEVSRNRFGQKGAAATEKTSKKKGVS